jgi:hypothetical protein
VDPRSGVVDLENSTFLTLQGPLCRPVCSQSLYRLRYSGSPVQQRADSVKTVLCDMRHVSVCNWSITFYKTQLSTRFKLSSVVKKELVARVRL